MAKIHVLPKHLSDLIAAGEVVERPASVVKELMENSIDAGATSVTVEIKRGGITYIRITDNGCGIHREDIRNAFKSHATSKILTEEDLHGIGTLGFRGEALASVAAVAKIDVLTKTPDEEIGTIYKIEGSEEVLMDDAGCPNGTTIVVKDIFYNTPARMKFLKKDVTEGNSVAGVVDRIALSHPEVSVRFIRDDKQLLVTPGNGKLPACVYSVFGRDFSNTLMETEYELDGIKVSGLISRPVAARANRAMQFFFLNGRLVKSGTACAALEQAYKNSIMIGKFPACVLNIYAPLESVDVNVHPAKTEVRFENEKRIFDAVFYAAKMALDEKDKPNKIDLTKLEMKNKSPFHPDAGEQVTFQKNPEFWSNELPKEYKKKAEPRKEIKQEIKKEIKTEITTEPPIKITGISTPSVTEKADVSVQRPLEKATYPIVDKEISASESIKKAVEQETAEKEPAKKEPAEEVSSRKQKEASEQTEAQVPAPPKPYVRIEEKVKLSEPAEEAHATESAQEDGFVPVTNFKVIGEAFSTYILVECEGKIILIDKHAAHERMLFEQLKAESKTENGNVKSQLLLEPVTVTLSKEEYSAILSNREILLETGFSIDDFGSGCVVVRECPVMLVGDDIKSIVEELAGYLLSSREAVPEKLDWIYHNTACRAAIKAGDNTPAYEQDKFVEKLLSDRSIRYCPHGRPVLIEMSKSDLEKQFGRIV